MSRGHAVSAAFPVRAAASAAPAGGPCAPARQAACPSQVCLPRASGMFVAPTDSFFPASQSASCLSPDVALLFSKLGQNQKRSSRHRSSAVISPSLCRLNLFTTRAF